MDNYSHLYGANTVPSFAKGVDELKAGDRLTPIEDVLVAAYHHAMKTHGLRPRDHVCELDWRRERP